MRLRLPDFIALSLAMLLLAGNVLHPQASAEDWPCWRGEDRTDISKETGLLPEWSQSGPKKVWMFENAGKGYSGPAIVDGRLFTLGTRDDRTILLALDAETGEEIWATPFREILGNGWGDGPRSTPSVVDGMVYALSGEGALICAKASDGSVVWQKEMTTDFGGKVPNWGYSESPLIDGDKIITTPGGSDGTMLALNRMTGEKIWQSLDIADNCHYSSVIRAEHNGKPQYIQLTKGTLFGVSVDDGSLLWSSEWNGRTAVIPTPIYHDGSVYIASGYGVGCKLVAVNDNNPVDTWVNKNMINHHGGVILLDGHLYGYSDGKGWSCQDIKTGDLVWSEKKALEKGCIAYADGKFYCVSEKTGDVVLIDATADRWKERGRFRLDPQTKIRASKGKVWTHPVISNGKLYLRDQDLIYAYDIKAK